MQYPVYVNLRNNVLCVNYLRVVDWCGCECTSQIIPERCILTRWVVILYINRLLLHLLKYKRLRYLRIFVVYV